MGNPAYDARREAERAAADKSKAADVAMTAAIDAFTELMTGKASLSIMPNWNGTATGGSGGWVVRVVRDRTVMNG